jgi:hypothetical protein
MAAAQQYAAYLNLIEPWWKLCNHAVSTAG